MTDGMSIKKTVKKPGWLKARLFHDESVECKKKDVYTTCRQF
jgi:hypothetical protein